MRCFQQANRIRIHLKSDRAHRGMVAFAGVALGLVTGLAQEQYRMEQAAKLMKALAQESWTSAAGSIIAAIAGQGFGCFDELKTLQQFLFLTALVSVD